MTNYIIFGVSICFISWVVAIVLNSLLLRTQWYERLSELQFIRSSILHRYLGVNVVKWVIKNTFFKYFNPAIKLDGKGDDLLALRAEMTKAEISHLIGFGFVTLFAVYYAVMKSILFGLIIMLFNLLMNLYPSLIQQQNKKRLERLIRRRQKASAS